VKCTELLDPAALGFGPLTPPDGDGAYRPEDGVYPLGANVVSAMQAQVKRCSWTNGTEESQYGPLITVTVLADHSDAAASTIASERSAGGADLGVGDRSSGSCGDGESSECDADVMVGTLWVSIEMRLDPDHPAQSRAAANDTLIAAAKHVVGKLGGATPAAAWKAPESSVSWPDLPCSALGGDVQLKDRLGAGEWKNADDPAGPDGALSTALNEDTLSCRWAAADSTKRSDGTDPSFGVQIVQGGGWIWPHLGTGLPKETSTPIDVQGAKAAAYRCYDVGSTYCWGEAVYDNSLVQLAFDYPPFTGKDTTTAALAAVIAAHDAD